MNNDIQMKLNLEQVSHVTSAKPHANSCLDQNPSLRRGRLKFSPMTSFCTYFSIMWIVIHNLGPSSHTYVNVGDTLYLRHLRV